MRFCPRLMHFCLAAIAVALGVLPHAAAQETRRDSRPPVDARYVEIPFDGDLQAALLKKLQAIQANEDFLKRLQDSGIDPKQVSDLQQKVKQLQNIQSMVQGKNTRDYDKLIEEMKQKFANGEFKDLQNFKELDKIKNSKQFKDLQAKDPAQFKKLLQDFNKIEDLKSLEKNQDFDAFLKKLTENWQQDGGKFKLAAVPERPRPDRAAGNLPKNDFREQNMEWLKDSAEWLADSGLGEALRDSPAWQESLRDLRISMLRNELDPSRLPTNWIPEVDWSKFELPNVNMPNVNMPSVRLPRPNLGRFRLPRMPGFGRGFGGFGGGLPRMPRLDAMQAVGWVLLAVAACVLIFAFVAKNKFAVPGSRRYRRSLVCPVDLANVTTRGELVQAYDYLALSSLGERARPWHHHKVAGEMRGLSAEEQAAVDRLTELYEQARYTDGAELLPDAVREAVRRDLKLLANLPVIDDPITEAPIREAPVA